MSGEVAIQASVAHAQRRQAIVVMESKCAGKLQINCINLEIAEITIKCAAREEDVMRLKEPFEAFVSARHPDLRLSVSYGETPPVLPEGRLVFRSGGLWTLSRSDERWLWRLGQASRLGIFSPDFSSGHLYLQPP